MRNKKGIKKSKIFGPFLQNKKGMVVAHWFDYIFIVFISLFGFLIIYLNFVSSIEIRNDQSLEAVSGVNLVQNYVLENRAKFENGEDVDSIKIIQEKRYIQKYRRLPGGVVQENSKKS